MKRKGTHFLYYISEERVQFDVRKDIEPERLAAIGAVALSWNLIETLIDVCVGLALELHPDMWSSVTSRINGIEGKVELLKETARIRHEFSERDSAIIADTFGSVMLHKRYRDGVIHARIFHPTAIVAPSHERRGGTFEVLVSKGALDALYAHLDMLCCECAEITSLFFSSARCLGNISRHISEDEKREAAQEFQAGIVLLLDLQRQRKALRPLPRFQEEPLPPEELEEPQSPQD